MLALSVGLFVLPLGIPGALRQAAAQTMPAFTVNSTTDDPDVRAGDGICRDRRGVCTLRAAIQEANLRPGPDRIQFAIGGRGQLRTIQLSSMLPPLEDYRGGTTIDGYTQFGAAVNTGAQASNAVLTVELRGTGRSGIHAIQLLSPRNVIRGLAFYNFRRAIDVRGPNGDDNVIVGSFVGTNAAGTFTHTGSYDIAHGINVASGAARTIIGTPALADRNVISGNASVGIITFGDGTDGTLIQNNIIGLNPRGTGSLPNRYGIDINRDSSHNIIGGTGPNERNVISGNNGEAIEISHNPGTGFNRAIGNFLGTDLTGARTTSWSGNGSWGIQIQDAAQDNYVAHNVIGGNGRGGIHVNGYNSVRNVFEHNYVGVTPAGAAIPNGGKAVLITYHAQYTRFGPGNVVANNPTGIQVGGDPDNDFNTIMGNSIYNNGAAPGIDIFPLGSVNPNDSGDRDTGANQQLNFPVLTSATTRAISGTACSGCTVEMFTATGAAGANGSGRTLVAGAIAGSDGRFSVPATGLQVGAILTATATDASGNTSEFSANVAVVQAPNEAPAASFTTGCTGLVCRVDASASTDTDGAVAAYAWDFGDGTTGSGQQADHTFGVDGTYRITLTVTDDKGAAGQQTANVLATRPDETSTVLVADSFTRTVAGGWGTTDSGATWRLASSDYAVDGSVGSLSLPSAGAGRTSLLNGVTSTYTDLSYRVATSTTAPAGSIYSMGIARRTGAGEYRMQLRFGTNGGLNLRASRMLGSTETLLASEVAVPGLTHTPGAFFRVRLQAIGSSPTVLRAKVWADGTAEPANWVILGTDATPELQSAGGVGLRHYLAGTATAGVGVTVDDLQVRGT